MISFFRFSILLIAVAGVFSVASAGGKKKCPKYVYKVVYGTGHDYYKLEKSVNSFKYLLGGHDNKNYPYAGGKGFRSIKWDESYVPFYMPYDFFRYRRGAIFKTKYNKFAVSNPPKYKYHLYDDRFSSIIPKYVSKMFTSYSGRRLFSPVKDNKFVVKFGIPGRKKDAYTRGFGAVFSDVDLYKKTSMSFYDIHGCLIAYIDVPKRPQGLSFVGVVVYDTYHKYQIPVISKVVIKLGTLSLKDVAKYYYGHYKNYYKKKSYGGDIVLVDDLYYGEPVKPYKNPYSYGYYGYVYGSKYKSYIGGHGRYHHGQNYHGHHKYHKKSYGKSYHSKKHYVKKHYRKW